MARYPGATWRPLASKYLPGTKITSHERMTLHVAVSEATSLYGYFNASGRASSHFYVARNGAVEQYVDTAYRAEADLNGNATSISVETQGGVSNANGEPWTEAQVEALAALFAWAVQTHGIEVRLASDSKAGASSRGLAWHRLGVPATAGAKTSQTGGALWSSAAGKVCPGNAKIAQIPGILERAAARLGQPAPAPVAPAAPAPAASSGGSSWTHRAAGAACHKGDKGPAVTEAQTKLKALGHYSDAVDGYAGPNTDKAIRAFQAAAGLTVDGWYGPASRAAAAKVPAYPGATAPSKTKRAATTRFQRRLRERGWKIDVDGYHGAETTRIIKAFQKEKGLAVDGCGGPATWTALHTRPL